MSDRFLVLGDNHGDTSSLRRVLDDAEGEALDYVVHVGDFTRAWRVARREASERASGDRKGTARREADRREASERASGDRKGTARREADVEAGTQRGAEQLAAVEPLLRRLDDRATHGLVWVYGNQDFFGDLPTDLDVGTEIPEGGRVTVGDHTFTNAPYDASEGEILVTHVEKWSIVDHFDGLAHFCGNTHRGRHLDRRLNAAFLHYLHPETEDPVYGGYFLVELDDDGLDVEARSIGSLDRRECERHRERGVQFQPADRPCMFCRDERTLMRELAASSFYGLTGQPAGDAVRVDGRTVASRGPFEDGIATQRADASVSRDALVECAVDLWADPPAGFRETFADYLESVPEDRYAPLARTDVGTFELADRSYAY
ncbi:hypothetical protein [Halovivax limisalsi]|uniref:hypothetical protein n=1 Tax=Halovivax limisalsi TaxID=1453760 RepID=UPI001FFC4EE3|nr:hypothetical protein [Halovivax limisalsi]